MIQLIPAIDIIDGKCVRLTQGDYNSKTVYGANPAETAKRYEGLGAKRLHVVDLDGAKASSPRNLAVLEKICSTTSLDVEWGGGIKTEQALKDVLASGAKRVICGSIAITDPETFAKWLLLYGAQHVILGADIRNGQIATHGWQQQSNVSAEELIDKFAKQGLSQVICTEISKDGMLEGPAFELYATLQKQFPEIDITVSGGISSMADIQKLDEMGLRSVIVGKAIYERRITLKELKQWFQNA